MRPASTALPAPPAPTPACAPRLPRLPRLDRSHHLHAHPGIQSQRLCRRRPLSRLLACIDIPPRASRTLTP